MLLQASALVYNKVVLYVFYISLCLDSLQPRSLRHSSGLWEFLNRVAYSLQTVGVFRNNYRSRGLSLFDVSKNVIVTSRFV